MSAWAETSVKEAGGEYPPCSGDVCGGCGRELRHGERVFRLCKPDEIRLVPAEDVGTDPWVCESCLSKAEPVSVGPVDEWPYDDDPPDPL